MVCSNGICPAKPVESLLILTLEIRESSRLNSSTYTKPVKDSGFNVAAFTKWPLNQIFSPAL